MLHYNIQTKRLGLRNWTDKDLEPFSELCADKRVMEFFPDTLTKEQTHQLIKRIQKHYEDYGYCYFAVDRLDTKEFIGFIGLMNQNYKTDFSPFIDIGWRLSPKVWGNGFATEGAKACLKYAFEKLNLKEIYSVTPIQNKNSERVMQKIGMQYFGDFEHPKISNESDLKKCVIYKIENNL